jgi:hypothetical protein
MVYCARFALGGHLWRCDQCSHEVFSYHIRQKPILSEMPHQADIALRAAMALTFPPVRPAPLSSGEVPTISGSTGAGAVRHFRFHVRGRP